MMETHLLRIVDTLDSFLKEDSDEVIACLEGMLYDWYQHYAQDHYEFAHISDVVNNTFRVNGLLLQLTDAMKALKEEKNLFAGTPV